MYLSDIKGRLPGKIKGREEKDSKGEAAQLEQDFRKKDRHQQTFSTATLTAKKTNNQTNKNNRIMISKQKRF